MSDNLIELLAWWFYGGVMVALTVFIYKPRPKDPRAEILERYIAKLPRENHLEAMRMLQDEGFDSKIIVVAYTDDAVACYEKGLDVESEVL